MKKLIFLVSLFFMKSALAYPIFFSCRADKSLSQVLTPQELSNQLNRLSSAAITRAGTNRQLAVREACQDYDSCLEDLINLTRITNATNRISREQIIQRIEEHARQTRQSVASVGITRISDSDMSELAQINRANAMTYSCRATSNALDPSLMVNGDYCTVGYFQHSPYMYVSGQRYSGAPNGEDKSDFYRSIHCSQFDSVIDNAVMMGQDPYAALGLAFMEQGSSIAGLYLDPIGMVKTLGCQTQSVPARTANAWNQQSNQCMEQCITAAAGSSNAAPPTMNAFEACQNTCQQRFATTRPYNLDSFSTFYRVNYGAVTNNNLSNRVLDFVRAQAPEVEWQNRSGYLCSDSSIAQFSETIQSDQCCLRTSQMPVGNQARLATTALTYASLQQYIQAPLEPRHQSAVAGEAPARRLQRYNGYSPLMGGAEGVSSLRLGINHNRTPTYGYQAMDFILNSFMTNPMIQQKVREAEARHNRQTPNILCADLAAGSYSMPHDLYFNRHRDAGRMGTVRDTFAQNPAFSALTGAQQNVMRTEFRVICGNARTREVLAGQLTDFSNFTDNCSESTPEAQQRQYRYYMTRILPLRRTVGLANTMDSGYNWQQMTDAQVGDLSTRVIEQVRLAPERDRIDALVFFCEDPANQTNQQCINLQAQKQLQMSGKNGPVSGTNALGLGGGIGYPKPQNPQVTPIPAAPVDPSPPPSDVNSEMTDDPEGS